MAEINGVEILTRLANPLIADKITFNLGFCCGKYFAAINPVTCGTCKAVPQGHPVSDDDSLQKAISAITGK